MADSYRVLHVDDDPDFLELSSAALGTDERFSVDTTADVGEALRAVERGEVDCLVSDSLRTPGGRSFVAAAREADATVPIVLFTGRDRSAVADEALEADPAGYVRKGTSDDFGRLRDRLEDCAAAGRVVAPGEFTRGGSGAGTDAGAAGPDGRDRDRDPDERDGRTWRVVAHHEFGVDDEFAVTLVRAATHVLGDAPDERLYDVIDPESLERLLERSEGSAAVRFEYGGLTFEATADGTVLVAE